MSQRTQDIVAFLGLSRLRGVGFRSLRELGDLQGLEERLHSEDGCRLLEHLFRNDADPGGDSRADWRLRKLNVLGREAMATLAERGIQLVTAADPEYPDRLHQLGKNRPFCFFYQGDIKLLGKRSVGIVGTREPDDVGVFLARYAVSAIEHTGAPIVSGLAKGIDETAHEWALRSSIPNISVLGTGLFRVYPAKNTTLAARIVDQGGLLISEYPPHADPSKDFFVWRNRLQAAISCCLIVPQWKVSSGTAHTVRFAKELDRLSINLIPAGITFPKDHGVADATFIVPNEHAAFEQTIHQALSPSFSTELVASSERQFNLFGATE